VGSAAMASNCDSPDEAGRSAAEARRAEASSSAPSRGVTAVTVRAGSKKSSRKLLGWWCSAVVSVITTGGTL
jgi:hypothetical protein